MKHRTYRISAALICMSTLGFVVSAVLLIPPLSGLCMALPSVGTPIRYLPDRKLWILETERTSYVLGVNELDGLQFIYWGKRIRRDQDFTAARTSEGYAFESPESMTTEEYLAWGGMRYDEPCLKVTLADGVRDLVLKYVSQEIKDNTLTIRMKDIQYDLVVDLIYRVYPKHNIVCKSSIIQNQTSQPLVVESAQSGVWHVPPGDSYRLSYLPGRWAGENQLTREFIHQGKKVLDSRRLVTSHQMNPWFAVDYRGESDEEHGRVWFGALGWSGNWRLVVEQTPNLQVRIVGGYNDFDFGYLLKPGETLTTPPYYGGFTDEGFGEMSRLMHDFEREEILPKQPTPRPRPVVFNSWCVTEFAVNESNQKEFANLASKLGVEHFMVDDGWFGKRKDDHAGLGDWWPDPDKFPHGLTPLINYVHSLGMEFGLWVEPEMVNPKSALYRQHPDWVINFPGRPRSEGRNQLMLNLARSDVKEYLLNVFDKLLSENDIKIVKWDMNRHVSEPGWPEVPASEQKRIWVKYVDNFYELVDLLRARHPSVEFETSEGGGGRVDLGLLTRMEQVNTSDNGDAFDGLRIWQGYSMAYAPRMINGGVGDNPGSNDRSLPLKFRFLAGMRMGGSFGFCCDLRKWSSEDLSFGKKMADYYKSVRMTLQEGSLYRLSSPFESNLTATQYVSRDGRQAVMFVFQHSQQLLRPAPTIYPRGLVEDAVYRLKPLDDKLVEKKETLSGSYMMNHGLDFKLIGDFDSTMLVLERIE
ncbi:MAG TPA: alpha-galactosidase [Terriglobia bacterium]|nr:alpha-galactosidase [Terriglobia bacterium]